MGSFLPDNTHGRCAYCNSRGYGCSSQSDANLCHTARLPSLTSNKNTSPEVLTTDTKDNRKAEKLKLNYVSPIATLALAELMTNMGIPVSEGGKGYKPHDWLQQTSVNDLLEATKRHLLKLELGVDLDVETQALHATCAHFGTMALVHILSHKDYKEKLDDRGALGKASDFPSFVDYLTDVGVVPKVKAKA